MSRLIKSDVELEMRVLYSVCSGSNSGEGQKLLSVLSNDHFSTETSSDIYARIVSLMKNKGYIPTWQDLSIDPALTKIVRSFLKASKPIRIREKELDSTLTSLNTFRKIRLLIELGSSLQDNLQEETVDVDSTIKNLMDNMNKVIEGSDPSLVTHVGEDENSLGLVKQILKGEGKKVIPTGFKAFDDINSGFTRGSLTMLAGTTGSGKSMMASQIAENMAFRGARVGIVPLEMTTEENLVRSLSRLSKTDSLLFLKPLDKMTEAKRKEIYLQYKNYSEKLKKRGGRITTIEPSFAPSIEKLLSFVEPMGLDVLFIDYVGLLDGVNDDDQVKALARATAAAKRWAQKTNSVCVMLAQLSDDGKVKYSRAMKENANYCWEWSSNDNADESDSSRIMTIHQTKARGAKQFDFLLKFDYPYMTIEDVSEEEIAKHINSQKQKQSQRWKKEDREDDEEEEKESNQKRSRKPPSDFRDKNKKRSDFNF
jgi:replicative DNA helicase